MAEWENHLIVMHMDDVEEFIREGDIHSADAFKEAVDAQFREMYPILDTDNGLLNDLYVYGWLNEVNWYEAYNDYKPEGWDEEENEEEEYDPDLCEKCHKEPQNEYTILCDACYIADPYELQSNKWICIQCGERSQTLLSDYCAKCLKDVKHEGA